MCEAIEKSGEDPVKTVKECIDKASDLAWACRDKTRALKEMLSVTGAENDKTGLCWGLSYFCGDISAQLDNTLEALSGALSDLDLCRVDPEKVQHRTRVRKNLEMGRFEPDDQEEA